MCYGKATHGVVECGSGRWSRIAGTPGDLFNDISARAIPIRCCQIRYRIPGGGGETQKAQGPDGGGERPQPQQSALDVHSRCLSRRHDIRLASGEFRVSLGFPPATCSLASAIRATLIEISDHVVSRDELIRA